MTTSIVTGSASGIGAAIAAKLKAEGQRVIGIDRQNADIIADLSTAAGRAAAVEAALAACEGKLDGLVCCAGVGPTVAPNLITSINYFGMSELVDGLAAALAKGEQPAVTLIGSMAAVHGEPDKMPMVDAMLAGDEIRAGKEADQGEPQAAYAGSKYAITVFARRKAVVFGKQGIRINVVAPGAVETPLFAASLEDPRYGEATKKVVELGGAGRTDEIAEVVSFLQSSKASFVNGSVFFADGGMDAMARPGRF